MDTGQILQLVGTLTALAIAIWAKTDKRAELVQKHSEEIQALKTQSLNDAKTLDRLDETIDKIWDNIK